MSKTSCIKLATTITTLLFAGGAYALDVTVPVAGKLKIVGTNSADEAKVIGQGPEGSVIVTDNNGTIEWSGADVIENILFIGKGGKNRLVLKDVNVAGGVEVRGGSGNDILNINGTLTAGHLTVEHSGGNNKLKAEGDTINLRGVLTYESGNGKDEVIISKLSAISESKAADVLIMTAGGNDTVDITGAGAGAVAVVDGYYYHYPQARHVLIETGAGKDVVKVEALDTTQGIQVLTASGQDEITLLGNYGFNLDGSIDTNNFLDAIAGPGKDKVTVKGNWTFDLNVNCGAGADDYVVMDNISDVDHTVVTNCENDVYEDGGDGEAS